MPAQMPNNAVETSLEFASLADSFFSNRTITASLTSILVLAITNGDLYYDAIEAGELTSDVDTEEKLMSLQKKVVGNSRGQPP
ncbi:hypothetical protein C8J57DRAFT_1519888 [Mycena rebaudengoi]|nr:hypothetical protein C8J57DRAFT_1519888 [Mycena rebaudengoi]